MMLQVYYVMNVTDENARGVCEFHGQCDSRGNATRFVTKAPST